MSGGAYEYVEERVAGVVATLDRICRDLLDRSDPKYETTFHTGLAAPAVTDMMAASDLLRRLHPLLHAIEWERSADIGEDELKNALRDYAANR